MIPYLPPELIRQIIESIIPYRSYSTIYTMRQTLLRDLCLVSMAFRHIAQPLLRRTLFFYKSTMAERALEAAKSQKWGQDVYHVSVSIQAATDRLSSLLEILALTFSNLVSLDYSAGQGESADLSPLNRFSNLRHLHLSSFAFRATEVRLASLHSLTLLGEQSVSLSSFLNPSILPSLRLLIINTGSLFALDLLAHPATSRLMEQVDAIVLPTFSLLYIWPNRGVYIKPLSSKILFQADPSTDELLIDTIGHIRHLCLRYFRQFDRLAKILKDTVELSLETLYLDVRLRSPNHPHRLDQTSGFSTLLATCQSRKIEVVYEAQPDDRQVEPGISEEFVRRQRERRRLEADQTFPGEKA